MKTLYGTIGCAILFTIILGGCAHRSDVATQNGLETEFILESVNEIPLPAELDHGGTVLTVSSGKMTFRKDGTCVSATVFAAKGGKDIHRTVEADYSVEGSTVRMNWKRAGKTQGTLEGNAFTMNNEGMIFKYHQKAEAGED